MTETMNPQTLADAARVLRRVLAEVQGGRLLAATPREVALVRRLEGAAIALEMAAKQAGDEAKDERWLI
jgi:hypothetical protein